MLVFGPHARYKGLHRQDLAKHALVVAIYKAAQRCERCNCSCLSVVYEAFEAWRPSVLGALGRQGVGVAHWSHV